MYGRKLCELTASDIRAELNRRGLSTEGSSSDLYIRLEDNIRGAGANPSDYTFRNKTEVAKVLPDEKLPETEENRPGTSGVDADLPPAPVIDPELMPRGTISDDLVTQMITAFMQQTAANQELVKSLLRRTEGSEPGRNRATWDPKILDYVMTPFEGLPYEDPALIVQKWELGLTQHKVPQSCWVEVATRYLGNKVYALWRKQCRIDAEWRDFRDFLITRFSAASEISAIRASFHGDKQRRGEEVESFLQGKYAVFRRLYPYEPDPSFIDQVIELVDPNIRPNLRLGTGRTVPEFIALARLIERDLRVASSSYGNQNPRPTAPRNEERRPYRPAPHQESNPRRPPFSNHEGPGQYGNRAGEGEQPTRNPGPQRDRRLLHLYSEELGPRIGFRLGNGDEYIALVDTQASTSFVSEDFVRNHGLALVSTLERIVLLGNRTLQAATRGQVEFQIGIQGRFFPVKADVLLDSPYDLILGQDWLKNHDAVIDFKCGNCTIGRERRQIVSWRSTRSPKCHAVDNFPEPLSLEQPRRVATKPDNDAACSQEPVEPRNSRRKIKRRKEAHSRDPVSNRQPEFLRINSTPEGESNVIMENKVVPDDIIVMIKTEQLEDLELRRLDSWLRGVTEPRSAKSRRVWTRQRRTFTLIGGNIYYTGGNSSRICVPWHLRREVLHTHTLSGHPGYEGNFRAIRDQVYWPNMTRELRNYIRSCRVHRLGKSVTGCPRAPIAASHQENRWAESAVNSVEPCSHALVLQPAENDFDDPKFYQEVKKRRKKKTPSRKNM